MDIGNSKAISFGVAFTYLVFLALWAFSQKIVGWMTPLGGPLAWIVFKLLVLAILAIWGIFYLAFAPHALIEQYAADHLWGRSRKEKLVDHLLFALIFLAFFLLFLADLHFWYPLGLQWPRSALPIYGLLADYAFSVLYCLIRALIGFLSRESG